MGEVLAVRDAYRAQEWAMLIQECSASGLTKREFCQQRGISEKSFYYWLKKLRTQMVGVAAPQLVQLESLPAKDSILEIHYRGAEMKLPDGVDMDAVMRSLPMPRGPGSVSPARKTAMFCMTRPAFSMKQKKSKPPRWRSRPRIPF